MKIEKSNPQAVEFFHDAIPDRPEIERRQMFGCPTCFTNGYMFSGLYEDGIFLRLSPESREEFLKKPGTMVFEPMPGRPMKDYVVASDEMTSNPKELDAWIEESIAYTQSLPPKEKKPKKAKR